MPSVDLTSLFMIRGDERASVRYFGSVFFLLGAGLAIGQGTAYALFLKRYGIEYLPIMYVVLGFIMVLTSLIYFAFVERSSAERVLQVGFGVIGGLVILSWTLMWLGTNTVVFPILFLIYELASEWLIVHSGLYLSQNFDTSQLKRIGPLVFGTWHLGIIAGGFVLALVSPILGLPHMALIWTALLAIVFIIIHRHHDAHGVSPFSRSSGKGSFSVAETFDQIKRGLRVMWRTELVHNASMAMFFLVIAIYVLAYSVNRIYTGNFVTEAALGSFFGWLLLLSGGFALLLQFFLTNRLMRRLGVPKSNLIFPIAMFGSFGALAISFSLPSAILGTLCKDVLLPGIHRPSRHVLLNAIPRALYGSIRALFLVLILPLALVLGGTLLYLGQHMDSPFVFVLLGLVTAGFLTWFTWRANKVYSPSLLTSLREQVFVSQGSEREQTGNHRTPPNEYADGDTAINNTLIEQLITNEGPPASQQQLIEALAARDPRSAVFVEIIEAKIADAYALQQAIDTLARSESKIPEPSSGVRLLRLVLRERLHETIDICLSALSHVEDAFAVEIIQAGVNSGDRQSLALACEALHNLKNRKLAAKLNGLLDRINTRANRSRVHPPYFDSTEEVIRWSRHRTDPWLQQCAGYALTTIDGTASETSGIFERIVMLKATPVFAEVSTHDLRVVAQELTEVCFRPGQRVFDINDPGDRFYIIEKGRIGISTHRNPRVRKFVTVLSPGACLGEIGCFEHHPRSATAHVLEDSVLLALEKGKLYGLILEHPELSLGLLRGLGARLRQATCTPTIAATDVTKRGTP